MSAVSRVLLQSLKADLLQLTITISPHASYVSQGSFSSAETPSDQVSAVPELTLGAVG